MSNNPELEEIAQILPPGSIPVAKFALKIESLKVVIQYLESMLRILRELEVEEPTEMW